MINKLKTILSFYKEIKKNQKKKKIEERQGKELLELYRLQRLFEYPVLFEELDGFLGQRYIVIDNPYAQKMWDYFSKEIEIFSEIIGNRNKRRIRERRKRLGLPSPIFTKYS